MESCNNVVKRKFDLETDSLMTIKDRTYDNRIESLNILIETTLGEYYNLSQEILKNNEFQRRRIKSSSSVYSLLKADLRTGCVIPPIVLALAVDAKPGKEESNESLLSIVKSNVKDLLILDGLQRTYTIRDLVDDMEAAGDPEKDKVLSNKIRIEIYMGINKLGILYRMLTLNTGQSPMSSRHQIEIIYSDLIKHGVSGVKLLKQIDEETIKNVGEYNFKDVIDGFTSYLERDYLTIERTDILDNIKSLEKLSVENQGNDLFADFVLAYDAMAKKMVELSNGWVFDGSMERIDYSMTGAPFAKQALKIFNRSQVMTGFGSAIGRLIDHKVIDSASAVKELVSRLTSSGAKDFDNLIIKLDRIRLVSKKVGNDQRMFFHFFFRELFDKTSDGAFSVGASVDEAYRHYDRKNN